MLYYTIFYTSKMIKLNIDEIFNLISLLYTILYTIFYTSKMIRPSIDEIFNLISLPFKITVFIIYVYLLQITPYLINLLKLSAIHLIYIYIIFI